MASILAATIANAQTTKNKTLDLGDDVTVTYSYYLDENGEEVKHGKLTITEAPVNNNAHKGKKTVTCNYQHDKLTGTFTYSCNMSHYEQYVDYSKGVDYNVTKDALEYSTMWKKVRDQKESFTVDMYEGYLNGDINISFNARYEDYQLLTIVGKANKGVLVDGSALELKQDGETLESYQNTAPNYNKAKYVDYKAGERYGTGQYQYYTDGVVIEFGFTACRADFTLKYPRYTKTYLSLSDVDYWKEYKSGECIDIVDSISHLQSILDGAVPSRKSDKVIYDLQPKDIEMITKLLDSLKKEYAQIEQREKQQGKERIKIYKELFPKVSACYNSCREAEYAKYNQFYGHTDCPPYYEKDGKIVPVLLDANVENIACNEINKQRDKLVSTAINISLQHYNHYHREQVNENEQIKQYELDTLANYLKRVTPEMLDTLKLLRNNAQSIISKSKEVALLYTKTTSSASNRQDYSRANCVSKTTKKPIIYNSYIEIVGYLYKGIRNNSITDLYNANLQLDKINDKMIRYSTEKTKDLESSLNSATTEEKLKLFMQN